jgi:hypothetical protein
MSKKTSTVHYNENVKDATIKLFLAGKSHDEIERAIRYMVRSHKSRGGK